jgi:hypothetical protein
VSPVIVTNGERIENDREFESVENFFNEFYPAQHIIQNSFDDIFFALNNNTHNFTDTVNIILRNENIIKQAIYFFRNCKTCVRFNEKKNQIAERYISDLKKKKLFKFFLPAYTHGEGNCLFRAASQNSFGEQSFHSILRICAVYIEIKHIKFFKSNSTWNQNKMEAHIAKMARDKVYGGEDEQMALSFIFKKPILILSSMCPIEFNALGIKKSDPIVIWFDFMGEHFTSLLLRENVDFEFSKIRPNYPVISEIMNDVF